MRIRKFLTSSLIIAFAMGMSTGCGQGTDVQVAPAPAVKPAEKTELKGEAKKSIGPGTSGAIKKNPGGNS